VTAGGPGWVGLVGAVAVLACLGSAASGPAAEPATLLDLRVRRGAGAPVSLRDVLGGAPAVVSLWATYCAPCRAEVPMLSRAARRWAPERIRVIGVAVGLDDPRRVGDVAAEWGIDYETLWVPGGQQEALEALLPEGLPVTFFVRGEAVVRHDRVLVEGDLETLGARHLGLPAPAVPRAPSP
jgi:thiol-disulfide isomerase/thioredoxin